MGFEWVLNTPRVKEFEEVRTIVVETDTTVPAQNPKDPPVIERKKHMIEEKRRVSGQATRIRAVGFRNDGNGERLFIRFLYGRTLDDRFQGAVADDGIVYMGGGYAALGIDPTDGFQDDELLKMAADVLKWDGGLREAAD